MTAKVIPIASTARPGGAAAAAAVEGQKVARSTHSIAGLQRASRVMAEHGRHVAHEAAGGNREAYRDRLALQGEIILLAGLQLMAESGEA